MSKSSLGGSVSSTSVSVPLSRAALQVFEVSNNGVCILVVEVCISKTLWPETYRIRNY